MLQGAGMNWGTVSEPGLVRPSVLLTRNDPEDDQGLS